MATEPTGFDDVVHAPARLRICGLLRPVEALEFSRLAELLDLTPPTLSKHLRVLTDAGYVTLSKLPDAERVDKRRVAWVRLTPAGRTVLNAHIASLLAITGGVGDVGPRDPSAVTAGQSSLAPA
ncbi:MAG: helix-turn-helix domain-containing protein [Frankiales bacterium]|nr:helix-turn-helix domain-containing protein [Frankiales bacterium]